MSIVFIFIIVVVEAEWVLTAAAAAVEVLTVMERETALREGDETGVEVGLGECEAAGAGVVRRRFEGGGYAIEGLADAGVGSHCGWERCALSLCCLLVWGLVAGLSGLYLSVCVSVPVPVCMFVCMCTYVVE